jgi:hypothetical protein
MRPVPPLEKISAPRSALTWCSITTVVAAAGANLYLVMKLMLQAEIATGELLATMLFLLTLSLGPVAVMLYVALLPTTTRFARWSVLVGSVVLFGLNWLLMVSTISFASSTAFIGFVISIPILLGVAGMVAAAVAVWEDQRRIRTSG